MTIFTGVSWNQYDPPEVFSSSDKRKVLEKLLDLAKKECLRAYDDSEDYTMVLDGDTITVTTDLGAQEFTIIQHQMEDA